MRKRVGLARAIIREPKIVLYDEPTTGLDPLTTESVDEMILHARERLRVTSVVISHDIGPSFHISHNIAMLHTAVIVHQGPPAHLARRSPPHVQRVLSTRIRRPT